MSVKAQQKTILPHEGVELLFGTNNQFAITGPNHQITTINNEEIESTAHTVMFTTTETSANAVVALPTTWGQRQGTLIVLSKSQESLRYYGNDAAAKGADITTAPVWYRCKRPILNVTVKGVLAVLQTASEWIVLMADAVTCREVAVHPIVSSVASNTSKVAVIRCALTDMFRGSATFIAATMPTGTGKNNTAANVIDISSFSITSATMTLTATRAIAKTPLALAHLCLNAETGIAAVPTFNDTEKSSVGLHLLNALGGDAADAVVSQLNNVVHKVVGVAALPGKRWLIIAPVIGKDDFNADIIVVSGVDGSILTSDTILLGNNTNSTTNRIEKKLLAGALPTGRVVVINGHEVYTLKISVGKTAAAVTLDANGAAVGKPAATSLAAFLKKGKAVPSADSAPAAGSSSRLAQWATLVDATPADVFAALNVPTNDGSDDKVSDVVVDALVNINDLPDLASASLAQLPFVDWFRGAKTVQSPASIHATLKVAHLVFIAALKRGAVSVAAIVARAFDALYALTGDDDESSSIAVDMRHCLQQIAAWSNEQMGKQIGVVTVHCTGKSPAIKQAMFVPHQPFAVSVKRHADIDVKEFSMVEPQKNR